MSKFGGDKSRFPDTKWSTVRRAAASDELTRQQALADLLAVYSPALRAFLVESLRVPAGLADDLLHDFVVDKVLARKVIHHADQKKGRFRNYIVKALKNFAITRLKRERKTRGREVAIDEATMPDPAGKSSRDRFEQEWVQQLVRDALSLMEADCRERGRTEQWEILRLRVVDPALDGAQPLDYAQIVERFSIETPRQAMNLLATAKRCFVRHLRAAVGRYAANESEIDEELAELRQILG